MALLLAAVLLFPAGSYAAELDPAALEALDAAVAESHIPAMAIAVVDADGVVFERFYGTNVTEDTVFLLGSLSKSFTALCIMQLAESGALDLDEPVSDYVDTAARGVTIRQLLNHTSGYGTYQTSIDEVPESPPGRHVYSNLNYALLGRIVERVSGQTYSDYLREHVLTPLGMLHTSAEPAETIQNGLADQYANWFGVPVSAAPQFPDTDDWIQPSAGYISSSLRDMERYLQKYLRGGEGVVSAAGLQRMFDEAVPVEDEIPYAYGFGWNVIHKPLPQTVYRHAGLVETGMTCMYLLPQAGLGIIFMADMNDYLVGTDLMDRIGWNLVMSILGMEPGGIEAGEYWRRHGMFDLIYAGLLIAGTMALLRIPRFNRRCGQTKPCLSLLSALGYCSAAVILFAAPPVFFDAPYWVVRAFVPDLYTVLLVSGAMILTGGLIRLGIVLRCSRLQQNKTA
ncbi:MAG: beta-lactamase family protein [Clostridia bacterium]|nr:beta-lactamase family protein [Clostridia bacterium]